MLEDNHALLEGELLYREEAFDAGFAALRDAITPAGEKSNNRKMRSIASARSTQ